MQMQSKAYVSVWDAMILHVCCLLRLDDVRCTGCAARMVDATCS
jgi:hypothetical protein